MSPPSLSFTRKAHVPCLLGHPPGPPLWPLPEVLDFSSLHLDWPASTRERIGRLWGCRPPRPWGSVNALAPGSAAGGTSRQCSSSETVTAAPPRYSRPAARGAERGKSWVDGRVQSCSGGKEGAPQGEWQGSHGLQAPRAADMPKDSKKPLLPGINTGRRGAPSAAKQPDPATLDTMKNHGCLWTDMQQGPLQRGKPLPPKQEMLKCGN